MSFILSKYQKEELKKLFENDDVNFELLFSDIETQLSLIVIPTNNKILANDTVKLLRRIEQKSRELRLLVDQLDEEQMTIVYTSSSYTKGHLEYTLKDYERSNSIEILSQLEESCVIEQNMLKGRYGRGAWNEVVDTIGSVWPSGLGIDTKITLSSQFVRFFSIILNEVSYEAIVKRIKRSQWYWQFNLLNNSQDKL